MSTPTAVLPQSVGYGVVLGIGFFFTALMAMISFIQVRRLELDGGKNSFDFLRTDTHVSH